MKNRQIVSNVLFCLIIGLIVVASFVGFANSRNDKYPFDEPVIMAKHNSVEIKNIEKIMPNENGEITMNQLSNIPDNAVLGEIKYNNSSIPVIYNCNDVSLIETATLMDKGEFVGEIGCAKIYGYRVNMEEFVSANLGDTINVTMPYGEYEFKCVQKATADNEWDASRQNFDVSVGLVIYTDVADEYGFSGGYDMAVFEMVSGPKIVG